MQKEQEPRGIVIGIGNQKGGVGKSTNTVHIAAALGEKGYRVLVIDLDPSAGATKHLGILPNGFAGTLELLTTEETPQTLALSEGMPDNVHLIAARAELAELEKLLSKYVDRTSILDRALRLARPDYDFVLLDTPPNPQAPTTIGTYSAADWFLLSVFPHPLSVGGLNEAFKDIIDVRARKNPRLEVLGVVLTSVDRRTNLWRDVLDVIMKAVPGRDFATMIPQAIEVAKAAGQGKTIFQTRNGAKHDVADQYRNLADEIAWRTLNRESFLAGTLPSPDRPDRQKQREPVEVDSVLPPVVVND
jgi:chromosome partitioning protein